MSIRIEIEGVIAVGQQPEPAFVFPLTIVQGDIPVSSDLTSPNAHCDSPGNNVYYQRNSRGSFVRSRWLFA